MVNELTRFKGFGDFSCDPCDVEWNIDENNRFKNYSKCPICKRKGKKST